MPAEIRLPIKRSAFGRTSVQHIDSKSILTPTSGFMSQYKFTLNPYGACAFGCEYCEARQRLARILGKERPLLEEVEGYAPA